MNKTWHRFSKKFLRNFTVTWIQMIQWDFNFRILLALQQFLHIITIFIHKKSINFLQLLTCSSTDAYFLKQWLQFYFYNIYLQIKINTMDRAIPTINKFMKKKEDERNRVVHLDHLKNIKPMTTDDFYQPTINNKKKQQIMQSRFTQIERQNRILLQKITGIMGKKRSISSQISNKQPTQKSLNVTFRKKQYQEIEIQNAKLLKRLQQKKSDYGLDKLKKQWKRQKYVIRNISNYPITIFQKDIPKKKVFKLNPKPNQKSNVWQMTKIKLIDGHTFSISIRFDDQKLTLLADQKTSIKKETKVIEIQREQALQFIAHQCQNNIQNLFDRLKYDGETLYLVGDQLNEESNNKQQVVVAQQQKKVHHNEEKISEKHHKQNQIKIEEKHQSKIKQNHKNKHQLAEQQYKNEYQSEKQQQNKKHMNQHEQIIQTNENKIIDEKYQNQYQQQNFGELIEEETNQKNQKMQSKEVHVQKVPEIKH